MIGEVVAIEKYIKNYNSPKLKDHSVCIWREGNSKLVSIRKMNKQFLDALKSVMP